MKHTKEEIDKFHEDLLLSDTANHEDNKLYDENKVGDEGGEIDVVDNSDTKTN